MKWKISIVGALCPYILRRHIIKWFKHFSNAKYDPKIMRLIRKYGLEGYGLYFAIVEYIAYELETNSPYPDIEETAQDIAEFFHGDTIRIEEIMLFCIHQGLFEQDMNTGKITCLKLLAHLDNTMSSNPEIKSILCNFKKLHEKNEEEKPLLKETSSNFNKLNTDKIRLDENRVEKNKEAKKEKDFNTYDENYLLLYAEYPLKKSKSAGERCYLKLIEKGAKHSDLLNAVKNYYKAEEKKNDNFKYTLHISTFLGQDNHWRDYAFIDIPEKKKIKQPTFKELTVVEQEELFIYGVIHRNGNEFKESLFIDDEYLLLKQKFLEDNNMIKDNK